MIRALDSEMELVSPMLGTAPFYCQVCGEEVVLDRCDRFLYFRHADSCCLEQPGIEPVTEVGLEAKGFFSTLWSDTLVDEPIGSLVAPVYLPRKRMVIEIRAMEMLMRDVRQMVKAWNALDITPFWVWCRPAYGNFRVFNDETALMAKWVEKEILDITKDADIPYVFWDDGQLKGFRIYRRDKEKMYYGDVEEINIGEVSFKTYSNPDGRLIGLDDLELQRKLV